MLRKSLLRLGGVVLVLGALVLVFGPGATARGIWIFAVIVVKLALFILTVTGALHALEWLLGSPKPK